MSSELISEGSYIQSKWLASTCRKTSSEVVMEACLQGDGEWDQSSALPLNYSWKFFGSCCITS